MSQQQQDYMLAYFDMSCDLCDIMFESFPHAKRHYLSTHETKGYIKCCNKKMRTLLAINDHIQWHKNPESLKYINSNFIDDNFNVLCIEFKIY